MNAALRGRQDLLSWEENKPRNFFDADTNLHHILRQYLGEDTFAAIRAELSAFGAEVATRLDVAAHIEDRIGNHPRLERWSGLGERLEQIEFHPNHDLIGRSIWQAGLMALQAQPGQTVHQMALYYLLAHNGEGGHMCSLACTSGLIRALQQAADDTLRAKYLPPLLSRDYDTMQHGAQFLTEVQGGSDVGANAIIAEPMEHGTWRIHGEKWFCSNINADQYLMTARATDSAGTRGLGLFLVPRLLDDGTVNYFTIRRLKDKLGTRTLASAEVDFNGAVAYAVGPVESGFKITVELVLNTSRLMNAIACAGIMRRAFIEAATYACHRQAFGQAIANYPMVQEAIADLLSEAHAATASSFYLAHLLDRIETGVASDDERDTYRLLVNVNKYITSIRGSEMVHRAIEVLGGNGAIESFSILPRLYRDMIVLESWEGAHNVLCLQVLRDIQRYQIHAPFLQAMQSLLVDVTHPHLHTARDYTRHGLEVITSMLQRLQTGGEDVAQAHARRLVDRIGLTAQAVLMLAEAQSGYERLGDGTQQPAIKTDVIDYFVNKHLRPGYDVLEDETYLPRLARMMTSI